MATAPAYKGSVVANYGASTTSVTVDPSTPSDGTAASAGDVIVFTSMGAAGASATATPSNLTNATKIAGSTWGTRWWSVWIGTYAGSAITQTVPSSNGAQASAAWVSGGSSNPSDWVLGTGAYRSTSGSTNTSSSITTVNDNTLALTISGDASTATETDITSITGATERKFFPQDVSPQIHTTLYADKVITPAGASGSVVVTYPNASGNGAIVTVGIAPSGSTPPTAAFTGTRTGYTVTFSDGSTGTPTSWAWDFGDGNSSTSQNPVHKYAKHNTYNVKLTVTNAGGSTNTTNAIIVPGLIQRMVSGAPVEHDLYRMVSGSPVQMQQLLVPGNGQLGHDLYDDMRRYVDTTIPTTATTGQNWSLYSGPASCVNGYFDSGDSTAAYLYASSSAEITYISARFRFNTLGGTLSGNNSSLELMVWDHIETISTRVSRAHVAFAPNAAIISTFPTPGGSIKGINSATISPALAMDTEHFVEITLSGSTINAYVNGVLIVSGTDPTIADTSTQRQVVFEPYYNNDATAPRVQTRYVAADWN